MQKGFHAVHGDSWSRQHHCYDRRINIADEQNAQFNIICSQEQFRNKFMAFSVSTAKEHTHIIYILLVERNMRAVIYLYLYNTNSVCVSVKYRRPNCWTDHDHIWHAYADRPGNGSYQILAP